MRFVQVLAYSLSKKLADSLEQPHSQRGIYYYGFQAMLSVVVKMGLILIISALLGQLMPTIYVVIAFCILRPLTGGPHLKDATWCTVASVGSFILIGTLVKYSEGHISFNMFVTFLIIVFLLSISVIIFVVPAKTLNKVQTTDISTRLKLKLKCFIVVGFELIVAYFSFINGITILSIGIVTGVFIEFIIIVGQIVGEKLYKYRTKY